MSCLKYAINNFKIPRENHIRFLTTKVYGPNDDVQPKFENRNPRNLERLRIAYKPTGYFLEKPGRLFWHKLSLIRSERHVTAEIEHLENGVVVKASTKEWALKKQLYRTTDTSAYINLGRVLAQRCLESGLTEVRCDIADPSGGKVSQFLKALEEGGVALSEPKQYMAPNPWDLHRPEKPWETIE